MFRVAAYVAVAGGVVLGALALAVLGFLAGLGAR